MSPSSFFVLPELTSIQLCHLITRIIYEYLLHNAHLPFPSILSPHLQFSHPKSGVCAYRRPFTDLHGYLDIQIGEITYVLEYNWGEYT